MSKRGKTRTLVKVGDLYEQWSANSELFSFHFGYSGKTVFLRIPNFKKEVSFMYYFQRACNGGLGAEKHDMPFILVRQNNRVLKFSNKWHDVIIEGNKWRELEESDFGHFHLFDEDYRDFFIHLYNYYSGTEQNLLHYNFYDMDGVFQKHRDQFDKATIPPAFNPVKQAIYTRLIDSMFAPKYPPIKNLLQYPQDHFHVFLLAVMDGPATFQLWVFVHKDMTMFELCSKLNRKYANDYPLEKKYKDDPNPQIVLPINYAPRANNYEDIVNPLLVFLDKVNPPGTNLADPKLYDPTISPLRLVIDPWPLLNAQYPNFYNQWVATGNIKRLGSEVIWPLHVLASALSMREHGYVLQTSNVDTIIVERLKQNQSQIFTDPRTIDEIINARVPAIADRPFNQPPPPNDKSKKYFDRQEHGVFHVPDKAYIQGEIDKDEIKNDKRVTPFSKNGPEMTKREYIQIKNTVVRGTDGMLEIEGAPDKKRRKVTKNIYKDPRYVPALSMHNKVAHRLGISDNSILLTVIAVNPFYVLNILVPGRMKKSTFLHSLNQHMNWLAYDKTIDVKGYGPPPKPNNGLQVSVSYWGTYPQYRRHNTLRLLTNRWNLFDISLISNIWPQIVFNMFYDFYDMMNDSLDGDKPKTKQFTNLVSVSDSFVTVFVNADPDQRMNQILHLAEQNNFDATRDMGFESLVEMLFSYRIENQLDFFFAGDLMAEVELIPNLTPMANLCEDVLGKEGLVIPDNYLKKAIKKVDDFAAKNLKNHKYVESLNNDNPYLIEDLSDIDNDVTIEDDPIPEDEYGTKFSEQTIETVQAPQPRLTYNSTNTLQIEAPPDQNDLALVPSSTSNALVLQGDTVIPYYDPDEYEDEYESITGYENADDIDSEEEDEDGNKKKKKKKNTKSLKLKGYFDEEP